MINQKGFFSFSFLSFNVKTIIGFLFSENWVLGFPQTYFETMTPAAAFSALPRGPEEFPFPLWADCSHAQRGWWCVAI